MTCLLVIGTMLFYILWRTSKHVLTYAVGDREIVKK